MLHVWNIYIIYLYMNSLNLWVFLKVNIPVPFGAFGFVILYLENSRCDVNFHQLEPAENQPSSFFSKNQGYFPMFPIGSMYGLFTYMKGETWPHSRGNGLVNIPIPWSIWVFFQGIGGI